MSNNMPSLEAKTSKLFAMTKFPSGTVDLAKAQYLLREIDDLALLLNQVKTQTDRVQAAADAIGDSVLAALGTQTEAIGKNERAKATAARSRV